MEACTDLAAILGNRKELGSKGITFIGQGNRENFLSYRDLYAFALKGLSYLQSKGVRPRDEVVFQVEDNKDLIIAFWACILGGIVPVPLTVGKNDDHRQKLFTVWEKLNNPRLLVSADEQGNIREFARLSGMGDRYAAIAGQVLAVEDLLSCSGEAVPWRPQENDIAFLQFSSGSTGSPKGVMLTHRNLIANMEAISQASRYSRDDSTISWMPLTHDMGLIGFHLNPLLNGMDQYLIPTGLFIRRPALWLDKVSEHRITILCSPNFGYDYVLKYCRMETYGWDLSCVRIIYNGAEPISVRLCSLFTAHFSQYGMPAQALCPVYGLAEASLAVTISGLADEVTALRLDRDKLKIGDRIIRTDKEENAAVFVNVGRPVNNCRIRIVADRYMPLEAETIGHIEIAGTGVTSGYYNNAADTEKVVKAGGWLRTGDLGFMSEGCLYVTGRVKDIIFLNGRNYYPHDLEQAAVEAGLAGLNKIALCGYFNNEAQKEEVAAFVFHRGPAADFLSTARALKTLFNRQFGIQVDRILPVRDIPRTTSGKLKRFALLEQLQRGEFEEIGRKMSILAGSVEDEPAPDTVEGRLLKIWKTVLEVDGIGTGDNFLDAGGSSLKAAGIEIAMVKEFGTDISAGIVYRYPTIKELAGVIEAAESEGYVPIPLVQETGFYPLSSQQLPLYYAWEADKTATAYNIPVALRITGPLDIAKLEECIRTLMTRHDALRMYFRAGPEPKFGLAEEACFSLDRIVCSNAELAEKLKSLVQPFDLAKSPLFRVTVLSTGKNEFILFLDLHHIIADGTAVSRLMQELFQLYAGRALPPLPLQYRDYACWEKDILQHGKLARQEAYWLDRLKEELPVLEMPTDRLRPPVFVREGGKVQFELKKSTTGQLRAIARANRCSFHALLFAIYNILLFKYTGQEECMIGIPVAGRRYPGLEHVLGMFVNSLPIRTIVKGAETFDRFLAATAAVIREALQNQEYPFGLMAGLAAKQRDMSRNPLFDTMFIYQDLELPAPKDGGLTVSRHFFDPGVCKYDLSMEVFDGGDSLSCTIEYNSNLFCKETVIRLAAHFGNLADQLIRDPAAGISALQVVCPHEYNEYIRTFNETDADYPGESTIAALFDGQVMKTPHHIAVEHNEETLTYRQLQERADALARKLAEAGVAPGSITAIVLDKTPELIVAILGVLKAGGAYMPVDTGLPEERIDHLIKDSRCTAVLTRSGLQVRDAAGQAGTSAGLAYVMYTSGTTGYPKGVMIAHSSLVNYIVWAAKSYVEGGPGNFPLFTSVSFDLTVTSLFTPLITGNRVVIYEDDGREPAIARIIAGNKVNIIKLTPSHLKIIRESSIALPDTACAVRKFIVGGEKLDAGLARAIHEKFGGKVELLNEYGPTEATVGCMIHKFDPEDPAPAVPIGIPAANTKIYLLDRFRQPVPVNVPGEIYISGDGVGKGYLYKAELTAERFVPDPFHEGKTMYKTGDLARRVTGGYLDYIGRNDRQVKLNGYRIELAEIETNLQAHPAVKEAIATIRTADKGDRWFICVYYKAATRVEEAELRDHLTRRLPHYMVPARFMEVGEIPLTGNGKVNYQALPEPEMAPVLRERTGPGNVIEAISVSIWRDILGEKEIGITDNFFELGGDSIKAFQIASRLYENGIAVKTKDILTYQTIGQISLHAEKAQGRGRYEQGRVAGEKELSPIESWFFGQDFANPGFYNQSLLLKVNKHLDEGLLAMAFRQLIETHDGLRLNYEPSKRVMFYNNRHPDREFAIDRVRLTPEDGTGRPGEWKVIAEPFFGLKGSFDITRDLLIKAAVIERQGSGNLLFITAHHLVMDGVSWRILLDDLVSAYTALENGLPVLLPGKTASLADWQKRSAASGLSRGKAGEAAFVLPVDMATHEWLQQHAGKVTAVLDRERTAFLQKEAHRPYQTNTSILLNTALCRALKEWTDCDTFPIEQESHGRQADNIDVSRTIGWFTVLYTVALELKGVAIGQQIRSVKEQLRNIPDQGIGCGLAEIRFNYLGQFDREINNELFSYSRLSTGTESDPRNAMTAKLEVNALIIDGELVAEIIYNKKAHRHSTIEKLMDSFFDNLQQIFDHVKAEDRVHFTPADFDGANLDQAELNALFS